MVYIVFCYFIVLVLFSKYRKYKLASYLIAVYTFSLFFSILLVNTDNNPNYRYTSLFASLIYCVVLLFYFVPFFKSNRAIKANTSKLFISHFSLIGYFLSGILLLGCVLILSKIQEAIAYGLVDIRVAMNKDEIVFGYYNTFEHIGHSILRWLHRLSYPILILFFYAFVFIEKKHILKVMMFISSLSGAYFGLMVGGRTNLMYWILFFLFCLVLFWSYLTKKNKRIIYTISLVSLSFLAFYFIIITVGRAEHGHAGDTGSFLLSYTGQSYLNFCYFIENLNFHTYSTSRIFPLTNSILFGRFDLSEYRFLIEQKSGMNIGIFYTFIGDIFVDLGLFGVLIYSILYFLIAKKIMKKTEFTLSSLLIVGIIYQIPLHGVFYYSLWRMESSVCIIITILIAKYLQNINSIKWRN
ncbi:MAG TPA: oligosaccharide repeat unit polymerase [Gallicola sp.]|nr:oligosaccharide repeat unit polymerase [Gallicola sp.]